MTQTPWLGCIADDYTGGTDVAAALRGSGLSTALVFGVPEPDLPVPDNEVVVVALKTRTTPPGEAVQQTLDTLRWLKKGGAQQYYVKYCSTFDSTPAGNIGPVVDAVLDELGEEATVLCPASPEHGRTVFQGHLFVNDQLLSESSMATHPLTPMTDSDLRRVLAPQSTHPVGHLSRECLVGGSQVAQPRLDELRGQGIRHIIADAVDDTDLLTLAAATSSWRVTTGGAGLARAHGEVRAGQNPPAVPATLPKGAAVIIAGSCSSATQGQVANARALFPSYRLSPSNGDTPESLWEEAQAWLDSAPTDVPVMVYATASAEERALTQHVFGDKTGTVLEEVLAKAARHAVNRGARRVVVAGGETSGAVVQALGVRSVLVGQEAERGVPWCLTTGEEPIALLLKSGNFGLPDLLTRAVTQP
ncbi:3-oxo-tetronate kinase [Phycicoccus sonneratiae]|uniref:3-oxo-tetronate kinase n=1 Tax=Phycicoccus sonneratiae TaxID=2807628 RepID=A0ABS2CQP0_9MICO|nr:3-oxo-tetronate kinase [Phycicoccus sonneraticus]MBM6402150.1 four-carbon acid sugar kinase family protein [Phycicoccus sonneraticus]